jgi:uncharacterized protein YbcC (UPF0753/DUF2309 family)
MNKYAALAPVKAEAIIQAADAAGRAIPPLWPLASAVAVNPFLGQACENLATAGARLARVAGIPITMPRSWYFDRIASGSITEEDLTASLAAAPADLRPDDVASLRTVAELPSDGPKALPTVAHLAAAATGFDWPNLIGERFGAWAASSFDEGQALWSAPTGAGVYAAWRAVATHDLTPEIVGLPGFARHVARAPEAGQEAMVRAVRRLGLGREALPTYFHQLLVTLGGWAQFARYRLWQAELEGGSDSTLCDFLAIRLLWEEALFDHCEDAIRPDWNAARAEHAAPVVPTRALVVDAILQEAAERAAQRDLARTLAAPVENEPNPRPAVQAVFCIDVRSELFRRALESVTPGIRTLGFAGFFGIAAAHRRFASDVEERRLPVLLNPGLTTCSGGPANHAADQAARLSARVARAWGRFKLAAVSSFAFVEATGPLYVAKLLRDALGLPSHARSDDPIPHITSALDVEARIGAAETVLRAMSLTSEFGRLVILAGHGASVVNNPHASALQCGACGGYAGDVNARLLARLLNDREARAGLVSRGIVIPDDTLFIGALHDTTSDVVTLYAADHPPAGHAADIERAGRWMEAAGKLARAERAITLPRAAKAASLLYRGRNWAEVRPEWALAGCKTFIAAPRCRTAARSLDGRAFLHEYDWRTDKDFAVLQLIMTAPVVVASWISLQYYGSTVAPDVFGCGNKLLHNVVGGVGVVEGNGGCLRGGLPWQSVHDGEKLVHEPLRLSVCIEAPREAMNKVLRNHEGVRQLFENRWLHLLGMGDRGELAWRYVGDFAWMPMSEHASHRSVGGVTAASPVASSGCKGPGLSRGSEDQVSG